MHGCTCAFGKPQMGASQTSICTSLHRRSGRRPHSGHVAFASLRSIALAPQLPSTALPQTQRRGAAAATVPGTSAPVSWLPDGRSAGKWLRRSARGGSGMAATPGGSSVVLLRDGDVLRHSGLSALGIRCVVVPAQRHPQAGDACRAAAAGGRGAGSRRLRARVRRRGHEPAVPALRCPQLLAPTYHCTSTLPRPPLLPASSRLACRTLQAPTQACTTPHEHTPMCALTCHGHGLQRKLEAHGLEQHQLHHKVQQGDQEGAQRGACTRGGSVRESAWRAERAPGRSRERRAARAAARQRRAPRMDWQQRQLLHTTQHNTTQHNTTQHNTTQHNKAAAGLRLLHARHASRPAERCPRWPPVASP